MTWTLKKNCLFPHNSNPSIQCTMMWVGLPVWSALTGQNIFKVSDPLVIHQFKPEPRPLSPGHVHIVAAANLTALSVNRSDCGFTGGQFAQPTG